MQQETTLPLISLNFKELIDFLTFDLITDLFGDDDVKKRIILNNYDFEEDIFNFI